LAHVKTDIHIDERWFATAISQKQATAIESLLSRGGAEPTGEPELRYELFTTEDPNILYFKYKISIPCSDATGAERTSMSLFAEGSGSLRLSIPEIEDIVPREDGLTFMSPNGTAEQIRTVYASAHMAIGHRTIKHSLRHSLNSSG
jgi:hypothetical protein